jgi:membrane fusion protein (multidrug efflux system)
MTGRSSPIPFEPVRKVGGGGVVVPVSLYGQIKNGDQAEVRPEPPFGEVYPAKVVIVDRVVDAASGTFGLRLELPNKKGELPAGLKCNVTFPDS